MLTRRGLIEINVMLSHLKKAGFMTKHRFAPRRFAFHVSGSGGALVLCMAFGVMADGAVLSGALAQSAGSATDRDRIVVTGSAIESTSDATIQSIEVLTRDDIEDALAGSLGDTLAALPGVSSSFFGPAAGRPIIRGLGGDRVRVLVNGVGLIDASTASPDHAVTGELLEAERIEILRGASAIAYGGGAVGGVVNIIDGSIPTHPVEDGRVDGQLFLGATSVDDGTQIAARVRAGEGPFVFQIEAVRRQGDPYDIPGFAESARFRALEEAEEAAAGGDDHDHEEEEEAFGTAPNTGFEFNTLALGAGWVGERGYVGVTVRDYDATYGLPGGHHHHEEEGEDHDAEEEEGEGRIEMEQRRLDSRGEFLMSLGSFDKLVYSFGIADYQHTEIEPSGEIGTLFENDGWEARVSLRDVGDVWSRSIGVQARRTDFSAVGEEAFIAPVVTEDVGVFAAQRYDSGAWGAEGGARYEQRNLDSATGGDRTFDTFSLAGGLFVRPTEALFLAVSLSRTERAPTDAELFANGPHLATNQIEVGDPALDKETAWSLDLNGRVEGERASAEVSVFYVDYQDFIYLAPTGVIDPDDELEIFQYRQDGAMLTGVEFGADAQLAHLGGWDVVGNVALEYVRAETDSFGNLPRIPPFSATVGLTFERDGYGLHGEVVRASAQDDVAAFELPTDGHTLVNLSAHLEPFDDVDTRIILEVRNVTDEEGRVHASFLKDLLPLPGRNFRVAISSKF